MDKRGPVIIIEDTSSDCEQIIQALNDIQIKNDMRCFNNGEDGLDYLCTTIEHPFIILCDPKLLVMSGLELREFIVETQFLREKCIPFIFLANTEHQEEVKRAYTLDVQGFFMFPPSYNELVGIIKQVVDYWLQCKHPMDS